MAETGTLKLKLNYGTSLNAKSCLKLLRQLVSLAAVVIIAVLISLALASQTKHIVLPSRFQDFLTLSLSIVVEAVPFIILGAIVGSFIQAFVSQTTMLKVLPKRPAFRRLVLSLGGSIFPVCECGNVPVARSLLAKGLETSEATTFLLAAPILNPLTIITTWKLLGLIARWSLSA